ncbi:hypothetical protein [Thalassovita aquimarina]|uniref:Dihydroorotate dehydrogenase n=1 Tax=Thalassovita aquimarina TaxID=2785917 RepID=A0ABS5HVR1_9RHOB|nr:hypothetical protein [Thalassovita aquimarina]MBR9652867.1 hypothetical protein [Thalassovita aquimarina]
MTERDVDNLDIFFDAARRQVPDPSPDFMQRVLDDALAEQRRLAGRKAPRRAGPGRLRQFVAAIGGWPAVAGLATASVAGLWIGVNPPSAVSMTAEAYLNSGADAYLVDLAPDFQFDVAEG